MESRSKKRSKGWLFQCFKPKDVVAPPPPSPREKLTNTDPLLTYIAVAEKHGIVLPSIFSSALTMAKGGGGDGSACHRRKIGKDHGSLHLRQALVEALNHTSLGKIVNRSKTKKDTLSRSRINKFKGEGNKISNSEPKVTNGTNSNTSSSHCSPAFTPPSSSSFTCSSCSLGTQTSGSSSESVPMSGNENGNGMKKQRQKQKQNAGESRKGCFGSSMLMSLFFMTSLLALIMWGKFCSILCTSMGFFVVPRFQRK